MEKETLSKLIIAGAAMLGALAQAWVVSRARRGKTRKSSETGSEEGKGAGTGDE